MKVLWAIAVAVMVGACATLQYGTPQATVELKNAKGDAVGTASFWEDASGVRIIAQVRGIPAGKHGIHIHAVGKCDPPDFMTAGGHFNPGGKKHGLKNPAGPHAGDLPNLEVAADGTGRLEYVTRLVTLASGPTSLFDADGSALVVHASPDDDVTDPTGNSGGRIACGIVSKAPASPARAPSGY
ncbi:MAG: superoxide dismutase family protein [Candidatus Rokubacteria bacterium]|nr:superoxide dismutase family protein [Candidatus Rokubacteria bacterium]